MRTWIRIVDVLFAGENVASRVIIAHDRHMGLLQKSAVDQIVGTFEVFIEYKCRQLCLRESIINHQS